MKNENLVGIISDTHDNRKAICRAVEEFNRAGCSLVVHAGDYIAPFTVREFEKLEASFIGVFGNNDGEKKGLTAQFSTIGSLHEPPYEFEHSGKRFVVMHEPDHIEENLSRDDVDVIVYGHTHAIDIRQGRPMVINPGECCSWLTGRSTAVILDLSEMHAVVVEVE